MKIKMVEVARRLGISKATVSLAVNNKPGVSEKTKQEVLACIETLRRENAAGPAMSKDAAGEEMPNAEEDESTAAVHAEIEAAGTSAETQSAVCRPKLIMVVIINHRKQVVCDPELDLWSEVLATFESEARKLGYLYCLRYLNEEAGEKENIIAECNMEFVEGVIIYGTEMLPEDEAILDRIHKPLVLYDCAVKDGRYSCVCIDNVQAVTRAMELLEEAGAREIKYLSVDKEIYNFARRRDAFRNTLIDKDYMPKKDDIIALGGRIPEITENMLEWLLHHHCPQGFVFENYQISIGVLTALRRAGISVPGDVKAVGIDEIPEYLIPDVRLPQIKIPHGERAVIAMELLEREIRQSGAFMKMKIYGEPSILYR